ncbi:hypothetical protein VTN96DRAFT_5561 [Rasamsonia emersonii]
MAQPTNPGDLAPLEVDTQTTQNDSSYGDELSAYTASLTSSILNYRHENGRRYHAYRDGTTDYLLPNDEKEADRLDMVHEMTLAIMDRKLYLAPLKSPQRVIDLGTGTGIWAIDFADQMPSAEVIGCDLSPTQPNMVPPNVKFLVDDIEADWEYGNNPFDFIHARYLSVSIKNFPRLVRQCYRYAKPGGWVEFQDWDSRITSEDNSTKGTSIKRYYNEVLGAFERNGYETSPGPHLEQWFRDAGFVDVQVRKYRVPMGTWPNDKYYKKVGTWCMLQAEQGFEAGGLAVLTRFENWSKEDVVDLAKKAVADAHNRNIHPLFNFYVVYGRKPE